MRPKPPTSMWDQALVGNEKVKGVTWTEMQRSGDSKLEQLEHFRSQIGL